MARSAVLALAYEDLRSALGALRSAAGSELAGQVERVASLVDDMAALAGHDVPRPGTAHGLAGEGCAAGGDGAANFELAHRRHLHLAGPETPG